MFVPTSNITTIKILGTFTHKKGQFIKMPRIHRHHIVIIFFKESTSKERKQRNISSYVIKNNFPFCSFYNPRQYETTVHT